MAGENSVSFKVFLLGNDLEKAEVRRFGIDRDVVSNFSYLSEKLHNVFPALRGKIFNVSWKDSDADDVLISSDDELMIALTEMPGDVHKLYVTIKGNETKEQASKCYLNAGPAHAGVICDACDKNIVGFRYKCLECSNYDLCSECESKGCHPEHIVIRLPVPVSWHSRFGKRFSHQLARAVRRSHSKIDREEANADGEPECPFARRGYARGRSHGYHHGNHNSGWLDFVSSLVGDFIKPHAEGASCPTEIPKENANSTCNGQTQTPKAGTSKNQAETHKVNIDENVECLMNVGKAVADLLDPLGIDVDFRVEHSNGKPKEKIPSKEETKKNVSFADENKKTKANFSGKEEKLSADSLHEKESPEKDGWTVVNENDASSQDAPSLPAAKEEAVSAPKPETPAAAASRFLSSLGIEPVIGATTSNPPATAATSPPISSPHIEPVTGATTSNPPATATASASGFTHTGAFPKTTFPPVFYPPVAPFNPIPVPPPPAQWQIPPPPFTLFPPANYIQQQQQQQMPPPPMPQQQPVERPTLHPDPKINEAVEAMMSMGFSNDGGWLTQLVEMKNGDIGKVLDLLQPVKRAEVNK